MTTLWILARKGISRIDSGAIMDSFFKKGVVWQSTTGIFYRIVLVAAMAITLLLFQLNMKSYGSV